MALQLSSFKTRSLTAIGFVAVLLSSIYFSYFSFYLLFFVVSVCSIYEFAKLSSLLQGKIYLWPAYIAGVLLFLIISVGNLSPVLNIQVYAFILIGFLLFISFLFDSEAKAAHRLGFTCLALLYCVVPFALLVKIPLNGELTHWLELDGNYDYFKVLGVLFLIWANDTFAYLGGSLFGKRKLMPSVSPGKTWEGTVIGFVSCIGVGFALNLNQTFTSHYVWPVIGVLVGLLGTIGDLVESKFKRLAGVKDSGNILPGHGGILDRFDSLLFVSPFVYFVLELFGA